MISGLHGVLEALGPDWVQIDVSGVGFKVYTPSPTVATLGRLGERVRLHTYLIVRQDSLSLYGFATAEEEHLFELLLDVEGIGPKLALTALSSASVERLVSAILSGDEAALSMVPGVGKKTASRMILELKGKLEREWAALPAAADPMDDDALAALLALGYSQSESRSALAVLPTDRSLSLEEKVRRSLQHLERR